MSGKSDFESLALPGSFHGPWKITEGSKVTSLWRVYCPTLEEAEELQKRMQDYFEEMNRLDLASSPTQPPA